MTREDQVDDFRRSVRTFAEREILPGAQARDRSGEFPAALVRRLGDLGLMGISMPEKDGGLGLPTRVQLAAIEEVARADAALASIYTAHYLALEPVVMAAGEALRAEWLPRMCGGEVLAGFALTEPDAGSDIGSMRTKAIRVDGGWLVSGSKTFISNAREADVLVVFASTAPDRGIKGISGFVVPRGSEGISFSPPQEKMGIRSAPTYTVYLEDVFVPEGNLLGAEGAGARIALSALNRARIDVAAMANGIAARAWELARRYAKERHQFGRPIAEFQAIQLLLGQMDAQLAAARATSDWAADAKDTGQDIRRHASIAKYIATEACAMIVDQAVQVHGGAGFMQESEVERLYRDNRILRIFEGTSQIQLITIATNPPAHER